MKKSFMPLLAAISLLPGAAFAHTNEGSGFVAGLSHPVLGPDHLLAMVSVGILSAQMGGRAVWTVPATFVGVMGIGGLIGMQSIPLPLVEFGIALSVVALGIALAAEKKLPTIAAMAFVAFFAVFHGHAHGVEMPQIANPWMYALGFMLGTAGIHIAGVLIGFLSTRSKGGAHLLRYAGAGIAGMGLQMVLFMIQ